MEGQDYVTRRNCRSCNGKLDSVLDLGVQYLPRWLKVRDDASPKAPLLFCRCSVCGLLQLGHTVEPDLLYKQFWYRSGMNQTMRDALADVVEHAMDYQTDGLWLDIGANDGTLLEMVPRRFKRFACEPALNFAKELAQISDAVFPDYFRAGITTEATVITSIACFYDLDEPEQFIRDIVKSLAPSGIWVNQLNDSGTMLEKNAFDSICHEHVVYYDLPNLARLYDRCGLKIVDVSVNDVNGGSVRVIACHQANDAHPSMPIIWPTPTAEQVDAFARRAHQWRSVVGSIILNCKGRSSLFPMYGYGASTKGGTMLQFLGAGHLLSGIADRNPEKWGKMQAGIWVPIVSEDEMREAKPGSLFILPWAFRSEFVEREKELRASGTSLFMPLPNPEFVL